MIRYNLGFLIYTYNRINDAKINMEIIRNAWAGEKQISGIKIIHAYDGRKNWYTKKYLEDILIQSENPGHFQGTADLIDLGFTEFVRNFPDIDYLIVISADCWLLSPEKILSIINKMHKNGYKLASSVWGEKDSVLKEKGLATDFFIFDFNWAKKYNPLPLKYSEFENKFREVIWYLGAVLMVEKLAFLRFMEALYREEPSINKLKKNIAEKLYLIKERDPIYTEKDKYGGWCLKQFYPEIGLLTHHNPYEKREDVKKLGFSINASAFNNFMNSQDLRDYVAGEKSKYKLE